MAAWHTPGPWFDTADAEVRDAEDQVVADVYGVGTVNELANARLIAAAPEAYECAKLLESLCAWLLHRFGPDSLEGREAAFRQAKASAAIARAEGR